MELQFRVMVILFLTLSVSVNAQKSIKTQDSLVKVLVHRHIELNKAQRTMPGFRVQIYFGANRSEAVQAKTDFLHVFPDAGAYMTYQQPNFKIRVGDFKTRLEAQKFLKEIQGLYATAFIVKDDVKLPE